MEGNKESRFGDQINFKELFRVRGSKGLYCGGSSTNKGGMIRMLRFLNPQEGVTVNKDSLICLGDLLFHTELGFETIGVSEVFSNLFDYYDSKDYDADVSLVPDLEVFVPNYDKNKFKKYHAVRILGWFDEVITKMTELDGIKENIKGED